MDINKIIINNMLLIIDNYVAKLFYSNNISLLNMHFYFYNAILQLILVLSTNYYYFNVSMFLTFSSRCLPLGIYEMNTFLPFFVEN